MLCYDNDSPLVYSCQWSHDTGVATFVLESLDGCQTMYWGDNRPITNITSCTKDSVTAGWHYFIYKYPYNLNQPDKV